MSTNRTRPDAGYVDLRRLPKGPNGRNLCRRCGTEVPPERRTFCGEECVHLWSLTTNPSYLRAHVFKRDRGVCAECGADTVAWEREYRKFTLAQQQAGGYRRMAERQWHEERGLPQHRQTYWDADHIVPVVEGGGECDLDNIRTLCIPCHRRVTAALRRRLADQRTWPRRSASRRNT